MYMLLNHTSVIFEATKSVHVIFVIAMLSRVEGIKASTI